MATFFGEVVPVTNRAYNDAEDEEEPTDDCRNPFVVTLLQSTASLNAETLIVGCGPFASAYLDSLLAADVRPLATVDGGADPASDRALHHRRPPPALVPLTDDTCVCRLADSVPAELHHWLAHTMVALFEKEPRVVIIGSAPMAEYFCSGDTYDERPTLLVRCLTTRECELPGTLTQLEPPNVVKGLPAAVLSRCRLAGSRASLVHLYTATLRPDSETTAAYHAAVTALVPPVAALQCRPRPPPPDHLIYL